jgi:hypothetical protein
MQDLGFMLWKDPYSWMETNHTARNRAFHIENRKFKSHVHDTASLDTLRHVKGEFVKAYRSQLYTLIPRLHPLFEDPNIQIEAHLDLEDVYYWKYTHYTHWIEADNIDVSAESEGTYVAYTYDSSRSKLDYYLHVYTPHGRWTYKKTGGFDVAIRNRRIFFLEADKPLHYNRLVSLSLLNGKGRQILYEETNQSISLNLIKCEERTLFLLGEDAGYQRLWWINANEKLQRLDPDGVCFYPIGCNESRNPVYFVRRGDFTKPWKLVGSSWKLNREIEESGIEFCSKILKILISRFRGLRTIWRLSSTEAPKLLEKGLFSVMPYTVWPFWRGEINAPIWISTPTTPVYRVLVSKTDLYMDSPKKSYATYVMGQSTSPDGMIVNWALVEKKGGRRNTAPRGLMVVAYGAYGISTSLNTNRWVPWLESGWIIALIFVRGGGDSNETWAELGRMEGKIHGVEDFEASCKDIQKITGCGPKHTCIFGRSAGGLMVGNLVSRNPTGDLFACVYAEAPYVDLLKTSGNPSIPLTEYEYKEFGNPRRGPTEFEQALRISPIHTLPVNGAPKIHVLCRAGAEDIQVSAYESLKWIYTLRGSTKRDSNKLLYVNQYGHHTYGNDLFSEYAEDFVIINDWVFGKSHIL